MKDNNKNQHNICINIFVAILLLGQTGAAHLIVTPSPLYIQSSSSTEHESDSLHQLHQDFTSALLDCEESWLSLIIFFFALSLYVLPI